MSSSETRRTSCTTSCVHIHIFLECFTVRSWYVIFGGVVKRSLHSRQCDISFGLVDRSLKPSTDVHYIFV